MQDDEIVQLYFKRNEAAISATEIVELPEAPDEIGIKNYGIYYVPAVKDKYISGITLIDGEIQ